MLGMSVSGGGFDGGAETLATAGWDGGRAISAAFWRSVPFLFTGAGVAAWVALGV